MSADPIDNLSLSLMRLVMDMNKPKPAVSQGQCEYCLKMTTNWTTNYPKGRNIYWRCLECLEKQKLQSNHLKFESIEDLKKSR